MNALFQGFDFGLAAIQRVNDASEALIFFAAPGAKLHPLRENPQRQDENPKFHRGSGLGEAKCLNRLSLSTERGDGVKYQS